MSYSPPTDIEIDAARIRAWLPSYPQPRLVPGDRIRLTHMGEDPNPIPVGTEGTVESVPEQYAAYGTGTGQVWVKWDNGRSLAMVIGTDTWEKI